MEFCFVLGAHDLEMAAIADLLDAQGMLRTDATVAGAPVYPCDAYRATGVRGLVPVAATRVMVECEVLGLLPDLVCDHHHPGDPGYGLCPEDYLRASSLGQVLQMLGMEATAEHRLIAAGDHCLSHAYAGRCPGVDPSALARWREDSRARYLGISADEMRLRIERAEDAIRQAPRMLLAGEEVAYFGCPASPLVQELSEASARLAMPCCYVKRVRGRLKGGIRSASPALVRAWMQQSGARDLYGDPARGFAGGYY